MPRTWVNDNIGLNEIVFGLNCTNTIGKSDKFIETQSKLFIL